MSYPDGTYSKITDEEYHSDDAIGSTSVKRAWSESIWHMKFASSDISPDAARLGRLVHTEALEAEKNRIVLGPEVRRNANVWKEAELTAEARGQILVKQSEYTQIMKMVDGLHSQKVCSDLLTAKNRKCELSVFITHPKTGLRLKTRCDVYDPKSRTIGDIKTVQSIKNFNHDCWRYGYPLQASFYRMVMQNAGYKVDRFLFLTVEKKTGLAHAFELSDEARMWADKMVDHILIKISEATESGHFSTGWGELSYVTLPDRLNREEIL